MWPAFPTSDYYEGSAPSRAHQSTTDLPAAALAGRRGGRSRDGSHVHHAPVDGGGAQLCSCSLATGTPQAFPVASPPAFGTGFGVDHPRWSCTADRPTCTRLGPASRLRSFTHWFKLRLHLPVSLAGPGPSGGADPSRRCRGCSHPPLRPQAQAAPSFNDLLRQANGGVLSPPPGTWRLVAHPNAATERRSAPRSKPHMTASTRRTGRGQRIQAAQECSCLQARPIARSGAVTCVARRTAADQPYCRAMASSSSRKPAAAHHR